MGKAILNALGEPLKHVVTRDDGSPILLDVKEQTIANRLQKQFNLEYNALGYEVDITTLTTIQKKITEQKFFEIAPADYLPLVVGNGAWSSNLLTYLSYSLAGSFEQGNLNTGVDTSRLASADAGVSSVTVPVVNWAMGINWTIMDLAQAAKAGNWDLVTAKERARKINWDLGIQQIAFLGSATNAAVRGLFTQAGVAVNTTVITKAISSMTPAELKVFCATVLDAYRTNCNRSAWPSHFVIPEGDYLGLASPASSDFPIRSTLDLLEETFKVMTKKDFKILPCAYGDASNPQHAAISSIAGKNVYVLLNYEETSLRMDIPVDYTNTLANSLNNFQFQNVGYGQYTGAMAYRPKEMLYFQY
jgi:hypothetical protein